MFAELVVRRGVPHCGVCGSPLRLGPGAGVVPGTRAGLTAESLGQFARLLPDDTVPLTSEVVPWSVSGTTTSVDPADPLLSECSQCERLSTAATGERCACGGAFVGVATDALPRVPEADRRLGLRERPGPSDPVRLYLLGRRRTPALLHHLAAREALDAPPTDVRLIALPTLPPGDLDPAPDRTRSRAALLRTTAPPRSLAALRDGSSRRRGGCGSSGRWQPDPRAVDRRRVRSGRRGRRARRGAERGGPGVPLDVRAGAGRGPAGVRRGRARAGAGDAREFVEDDLRCGYLPMTASRLALPGLPPEKVAVYRVLHHVLPNWADLYAPVAPFAMEAIHRAFRSDGTSIFERSFAPGLDAVRNVEGEGDYDLWLSVAGAVRLGRRGMGVPATTVLPKAILLAEDEVVAGRLRATSSTLGRLLPVAELIVSSPDHPWDGRHVEVRPVLAAIQRTYGAQSARVVRILEQIPARKVQEGIRAGTLSVVFDGRQMPILPGMVELEESLPPDVVSRCRGGGGSCSSRSLRIPARHRRRAPALSLDGYRVVRHVARRLQAGRREWRPSSRGRLGRRPPSATRWRSTPPPSLPTSASGRSPSTTARSPMPPAETTSGRGRRGNRWRVYVPGSSGACPPVETWAVKRGARDGFRSSSCAGPRRRRLNSSTRRFSTGNRRSGRSSTRSTGPSVAPSSGPAEGRARVRRRIPDVRGAFPRPLRAARRRPGVRSVRRGGAHRGVRRARPAPAGRPRPRTPPSRLDDPGPSGESSQLEPPGVISEPSIPPPRLRNLRRPRPSSPLPLRRVPRPPRGPPRPPGRRFGPERCSPRSAAAAGVPVPRPSPDRGPRRRRAASSPTAGRALGPPLRSPTVPERPGGRGLAEVPRRDERRPPGALPEPRVPRAAPRPPRSPGRRGRLALERGQGVGGPTRGPAGADGDPHESAVRAGRDGGVRRGRRIPGPPPRRGSNRGPADRARWSRRPEERAGLASDQSGAHGRRRCRRAHRGGRVGSGRPAGVAPPHEFRRTSEVRTARRVGIRRYGSRTRTPESAKAAGLISRDLQDSCSPTPPARHRVLAPPGTERHREP